MRTFIYILKRVLINERKICVPNGFEIIYVEYYILFACRVVYRSGNENAVITIYILAAAGRLTKTIVIYNIIIYD